MPLAYTPTSAGKACGLGTPRIVEAARAGHIKIRKSGDGHEAPLVILATDLQAWLESLPLYDMKTPRAQGCNLQTVSEPTS
jgi:hypothetical protein